MSAPESLDAWIEKAEEDFKAALTLLRQRKGPARNVICFECQQCAEKYLKGFLVRHRISFPKTHDLRELTEQCIKVDNTFTLIAPRVVLLKNYAVPYRYPGADATMDDAREAAAIMKEVRKFVRARLGLK